MSDKKLLSGNEALALGAYHAGLRVATAYPGTPSTEILEYLAQFKDIYAEWSTNEKVAMEVALGASYAGARAIVSMKHVGLNVASDPFLAASQTGVNAGLVVVSADDPGMHSSQNEQDNRYYAKLAKVPILEPSDSQEAYRLMAYAFDISEQFDTPVMLHTTTRISHSKSAVTIGEKRTAEPKVFKYNTAKYVMLPVYARRRHPLMEERIVKLAAYAEKCAFNQVFINDKSLGIISGGVAYQYAREVFPQASFLKLGMTYPLPQELIRRFAASVGRVLVIEELDPFLEEHIRAMGIKVSGKEFIPRVGELNPAIVAASGRRAGLLLDVSQSTLPIPELPQRPPLLCPGCPHAGIFFILSSLGRRSKPPKSRVQQEPQLIITGDIGCYTLGASPPLNAIDTTACMGAGIGQAIGMEKAGVKEKIVAVIGDSTFLHSGITSLINAVYDDSHITVIILDNRTTAMTGHQDHPGTGISAQGKKTKAVVIDDLVKGLGISNVRVVDAFNIKDIREAVKTSLDSGELSVVVVRGDCVVHPPRHAATLSVDVDKCNQCGTCLLIGCAAIQQDINGKAYIEASLCTGCGICRQICPRQAIGRTNEVKG